VSTEVDRQLLAAMDPMPPPEDDPAFAAVDTGEDPH
jgi:hypothetical protein